MKCKPYGSSISKSRAPRIKELVYYNKHKTYKSETLHIILNMSNEGTFSGDTLCFDSFVSHLIEYIEIVKSLKGFFPNGLWSQVMAFLLNF